MNPFKALGDLLRPPKAATTDASWEIPFGLTNAEWNDLKALRADRGFDAWLRALDGITKLHAEAMLSGTLSDAELHFRRGLVMGVRKAATLIDELKQSEDAFLDEHKRREPRERAGRTAALYGSPAWSKPTQRRPIGRKPS